MSGGPEAVRERYLDRLAAFDERGAVDVAVGALDAGTDVETVLLDVIAAAQRAVGDRWAAGEWTVVQEHIATQISERAVAAVGRHAPVVGPTGLGLVTVACLDGEWHGLPARLLAEVLVHRGWDVRFLGASVPAVHLAAHIHQSGPDVVAISSSLASRLPAARRTVEVCHATGTPVLAGGAAFGRDGRWARAVGADGWAPDARAAATLLAEHPATTWWPDGPAVPSLPDGAAHEEQAVLHARRGELVAALAGRLRPASRTDDGPGHHPESLSDDLGHLLDFLAASVSVDDLTLLDEFLRWVGTVAVPGGLTRDEAGRARPVLAELLHDSPRTRDFMLRDTAARA